MKVQSGRIRSLGIMLVGAMALIVSGCGSGGGEGGLAASSNGACSNQKICPVADAGPDQTVIVGNNVTLDGSGSYANTTGLITYKWTLSSKPKGSTAVLAGDTTVRPTFTADLTGSYSLSLKVDNGGLPSNADSVTVTAATGNLPPVANAGPDQTVPPGAVVNLKGSGTDADGQPITGYTWTMTSRPAKSATLLLNGTTATPSFTADVIGTYKLSLVVADASASSAANQVVITVATGNIAPVANAGPDQYVLNVLTGQVATLDGSGSVDPNPGDTLAYSWRFQSMPAGSTATLANGNTSGPTFTADLDGFYVLSLMVIDSLGASSPLDRVVIQTGPRFTVVPGSNNEAVLDHTTNLVWEAVPDATTIRNWADSIAYCEGKTVGGKDDWRLPSLDELGLLHPTTPPFTYLIDVYWTTTPYAGDPTLVEVVDFIIGHADVEPKYLTFFAWCVRG